MGHRRKPRQVSASHLFDPDETVTVRQLQAKLQTIEAAFGPDAELEFDAGYNNIDLLVTPELRTCYQCERRVTYLNHRSRCIDCDPEIDGE